MRVHYVRPAEREGPSPKVDKHGSVWRKYLSEMEILKNCDGSFQLSDLASAKHSRLYIPGNKTSFVVGEKVTLTIEMFDFRGHRKSTGGEYLRLWMENKEIDAESPGVVFDHNDGTYTGIVMAPWSGIANIQVLIARRCQTIALYYDLYRKYSSIWTIDGTFIKGNISQSRKCSIVSPPRNSSARWCNFTAVNDDFPFFCEKPLNSALTCSTWKNVTSYLKYPTELSVDGIRKTLFKWGEQHRTKTGILSQSINIFITHEQGKNREVITQQVSEACNNIKPEVTWLATSPHGFYHNNTWHPLTCSDTLPRRARNYRECLRNRNMFLPGDSTSRQFIVYLWSFLNLSSNQSRKTSLPHNPILVKDTSYNFSVSWHAHEQPFYHGVTIYEKSVNAGEDKILDNLPNATRDIVVLYLYIHLTLVHPRAFRRHVRRLAESAEKLLARSPNVTLAVRGPHAFYNANYLGILSYWGLAYADILREEFNSLRHRVVYLDYWDITVAKGRYRNVHPPEETIKDMVHEMMSLLCFRNK